MRHHLITDFLNFCTESKNIIGLPKKIIRKVYHVGDMDVTKKSDFSLEGEGLSVSLHPEEWRRIAKLSIKTTYMLVKEDGSFIDFWRLGQEHKDEVYEWGLKEGLVTKGMVFRVTFTNEYGEDEYMEFSDVDEAESEKEDSDGEMTIYETYVPTSELGKRTRQKKVDLVNTFDLLLTVYVSENTDYDGVWWSDKLDPMNYSAPRGVIFSHKLKDWKVTSL